MATTIEFQDVLDALYEDTFFGLYSNTYLRKIAASATHNHNRGHGLYVTKYDTFIGDDAVRHVAAAVARAERCAS